MSISDTPTCLNERYDLRVTQADRTVYWFVSSKRQKYETDIRNHSGTIFAIDILSDMYPLDLVPRELTPLVHSKTQICAGLLLLSDR